MKRNSETESKCRTFENRGFCFINRCHEASDLKYIIEKQSMRLGASLTMKKLSCAFPLSPKGEITKPVPTEVLS